MKKVIKRDRTKVVLDRQGVALSRGIFGGKRKFLTWEEIEAVGFYVGDVQHTGYGVDLVSLYPMCTVEPHTYAARDLFLYFSVIEPTGFSLEHILPLIKDERNLCINLGRGTALRPIKKRADKAAEKILAFYNGKILNRSAVYHK